MNKVGRCIVVVRDGAWEHHIVLNNKSVDSAEVWARRQYPKGRILHIRRED